MNLGTFVTRDGVMLWFLVIGALAGYLLSVGVPPTQWTYSQWLQFAAALAAWGLGKLQTSPAPSKADVAASTPGGSVDPKKFVPMLLLAAALAVGSLGVSGCAKAPPTLTPAAVSAFYGTEVIKDLDRIRDIAVDAHATTPPLLTAEETLVVVQWHQAAIAAVHTAPQGWKATVGISLDAAVKRLSPRAQQTLAPYVLIVHTLLQEIP